MSHCNELKELSPEQAETGAELALNNATALLEAASAMARRRQYGLANSLAILSVEEAVKSHVLVVRSAISATADDFLCQIFRMHKIKHDMWIGMRMFTAFAELVTETIYQYQAREKREGKAPGTYRAQAFEEITTTLNGWVAKEPSSLDQARKWYERANSQKNRGLYVDYRSGEWLAPANVSKSAYLESERHARDLVEAAKRFSGIDREELRRLYVEYCQQAATVQ